MIPTPRTHRDLIVWQKALSLAALSYQNVAKLPRSEIFGLSSQIRRAAASVPANIAEGSARRTTREFIAFLHIARGSLAELETHFMIAERAGYLDPAAARELQSQADEVGRLLNAVLRGLRQRQATGPTT